MITEDAERYTDVNIVCFNSRHHFLELEVGDRCQLRWKKYGIGAWADFKEKKEAVQKRLKFFYYE